MHGRLRGLLNEAAGNRCSVIREVQGSSKIGAHFYDKHREGGAYSGRLIVRRRTGPLFKLTRYNVVDVVQINEAGP